MTGGASGSGGGCANGSRIGATTPIAVSRNSEYNFWRAQKKNPTSFPRASSSPTAEVSTEYQTTPMKVTEGARLISLGNSRRGMIMLEANVITNQGMICTKAM